MFVAVLAVSGDVGIVVMNIGTLLFQQANHVERRTFTHIVDVFLVRDSQYQHPAAVHGLLLFVQGLRNFAHDHRRHLAVDLARQIDESRLVVERSHLPGEIVRIERDAVSADARPRRELHEAEGLRCRGLDYFPYVDAKLVADDRHLIDESDVHRSEGVLQQLDQLGRFRARHRNHRIEAGRVERSRHLSASGRDSTDDLRRVLRVPLRVAGIDALGTEGEEDIFPDGKSGRFQLWLQQLARRARISRALQNHHHPRTAIATDCIGSSDYVTHVRVARLRQRSRHSDRDCIHLLHPRFFGCRLELSRLHQPRELRARHVLNVGLPRHQRLHDTLADVVANHLEARLREFQRQRQPDVSQADYADTGTSILDLGYQLIFELHGRPFGEFGFCQRP